MRERSAGRQRVGAGRLIALEADQPPFEGGLGLE